jgi:hypothetical protein
MISAFRRVLSVGVLLGAAGSALTQVGQAQIGVVGSTVPANGDVNPYGIALVPKGFPAGVLTTGNILVSNFNNSANLQGTGSTIVQITPDGTQTTFGSAASSDANCTGGVGLTTALAILPSGWVIVGSLPTTDGTAATAQAGCLLIFNAGGYLVAGDSINGLGINGPWDMAAIQIGDKAYLFVTNVLNGTVAAGGNIVNQGTVVRLVLSVAPGYDPAVESSTVIGSGFAERTDPAALVIGPTGVALGANGTLYVADSVNNRIAAIPDALTRTNTAGTGTTVFSGSPLNDPLGLIVTSEGEILTTNGNNGLLLGTLATGSPKGKILLDDSGNPPGAGALFGLTFGPAGLYYVDDATNTLNLLK